MVDTAAPPDVKQWSAHVAMHADLSMALSEGFAGCGQQSMSSIAAMSESAIAAMSDIAFDFATRATPPAAGKTATDRTIRSATMVRATFMTFGKIADFALFGSSDEFARQPNAAGIDRGREYQRVGQD
jgi:hypothetical protein